LRLPYAAALQPGYPRPPRFRGAVGRGAETEFELHGKYAEKWGVELGEAVLGEATLSYTEFLLATAALRGVGETCAAMTPCMWLYAFLE
jgi:thiaminase/transcriptional activator TenA